MPEVESLSFTELRSDLLASLQGKCEHDQAYGQVWNMVKRRDSSPTPSANDAMSTHDSPITSDELNRWKFFIIDNGYLLYKGRICVPEDTDTGSKYFMSVMIVLVRVIQEYVRPMRTYVDTFTGLKCTMMSKNMLRIARSVKLIKPSA